MVDSVVAARRAVDALDSLPQVDRSRIGLVGWSSGARVGAILAGVDRRVEAFDLLSGGSPPIGEYAAQAPASLRPAILRELGSVDPLTWVARARPGTVLLQDGRKDEVVPRAALEALRKAAGAAAEVRWYDQGHAPSQAAYADQLDWMASKLAVTGPRVKRCQRGAVVSGRPLRPVRLPRPPAAERFTADSRNRIATFGDFCRMMRSSGM